MTYIGDSKVSRSNFETACKHFGLSKEAKQVAWESAKLRPVTAAACYLAIARSFGPSPSEIVWNKRRYGGTR